MPKKGLESNPDDPKKTFLVTARLCLCCDYRKLNQKLPAEIWSYDKEGRKIVKQGINAPYPLPHINKMLTTIRGKQFWMTLNCTGALHGLKMTPDTTKKSTFITHLGKCQWNIAPF